MEDQTLKQIPEIYVRVNLAEDQIPFFKGFCKLGSVNGILEGITQSETSLFASGADLVYFKSSPFRKVYDVAQIRKESAVRDMRYQNVNFSSGKIRLPFDDNRDHEEFIRTYWETD